MPQNKNLKMQWVTIDGRPVPVVLPQVWDDKKQDWVVTSDINPLPTQDDLVMQKIEELNEKIDGIIDGTTPANTQLTGSIVEDGQAIPVRETNGITVLRVVSGVEVTAGSRASIGLLVGGINTPYISISIRTDVSHDFSIDIDWRNLYESSWNTIFYETKIEEVKNGLVIGIDKHPVYTDSCSVYIRNSSEEDRVYDVFILGKEG